METRSLAEFFCFFTEIPLQNWKTMVREEKWKGSARWLFLRTKLVGPRVKIETFLFSKTFVSKSFSNFLFCKSRLQRNLIKLESCSVPDSVFWNFRLENGPICLTELSYNYSTFFLQSVLLLPWQSHDFLYIYTVRFNQIPCRSLRLHLSLQKKHQQMTTNS